MIDHEDRLERQLDALLESPAIATAGEILDRASDRTTFLFEQAIPAGLSLLLGIPGASKSWLAYDMALAVAQGRDWLGYANAQGTPARVLVLNYDNPTSELGRRFMRLGMVRGDPIWFHSVHGLDERAQLLLPAEASLVLGLVHRLRISLVVIDSLREAHTADENDSAAMRLVMKQLRSFVPLDRPAAVVCLHHVAKGDAAGVLAARGSTAIAAAVDAAMLCSGGTLAWVKHRGWPLEGVGGVEFDLVDDGPRTALRVKQPKPRKTPPARHPGDQ